MLALTHLVAGAALGTLKQGHGTGTIAGLVSHALIDGVGHDDVSLGVVGQAVLVAAGTAALALSWGPGSAVTLAGLAGVVPDAEIILMKVRRQRPARLLFPSHWQRPGRLGTHPYRFPGPGVSMRAELAVSLAGCAALCIAGRRRARRRG
jgi:hypothetical protein